MKDPEIRIKKVKGGYIFTYPNQIYSEVDGKAEYIDVIETEVFSDFNELLSLIKHLFNDVY